MIIKLCVTNMHGLFLQKDLPYLDGKICPSCGKIMPIASNVCPHCSFNLAKANEINNTEDDNVIIKKENQIRNIYCECCGSKLLPGQIYCSNCGAKNKKKICSNCHNLIDLADSFCPYCNSKQLDNNFTIAKEEKEAFLNTNNNTNENIDNKKDDIVEDTFIKDDKKDLVDNKNDTKTENIYIQDTKTIIKLKRKRVMLLIELIITLLLVACLLFIPIYVKGNLFSYLPSILNDYQGNDLVDGFDIVKILIDQDFTSLTNLKVTSVENHILFSMNSTYIASIIVCLIYGIIFIKLILDLLFTLFAFLSKKPFHTYICGSTTVILFILAATLYIFIPLGSFKGYETLFLYLFILEFFFYFICKLMFYKENKMYKIAAINKKMLKK